MRISVYFIFLPTDSLLEAAERVGETSLVEPSVWRTHESGTGRLEHSQEEVERAFWSGFRAQLFYEDETAIQRQFRERCNELGLSGCWTVIKTYGGGPAEDLIGEASSADQFLKQQEGST